MADDFTMDDYLSPTYRIRDDKKCRVIIFSKTKPLDARDDTHDKCLSEDEKMDFDAEKLQDFFMDNYGVLAEDITVHHGLTIAQTRQEMQNIKKDKKSYEYDVFFFIFLSFLSRKITDSSGNKQQGIQFQDASTTLDVFMDDLKGEGPDDPDKALLMKPKIFLVQADDFTYLYPKDMKKGPTVVREMKIPSDSDRLVIMSTIPQGLANSKEFLYHGQAVEEGMQQLGVGDGRTKRCSFMVQAFIEVMSDPRYKDLDLFSRTPYINGRVRELSGIYDLPIPLVTSTLTKLLEVSKLESRP